MKEKLEKGKFKPYISWLVTKYSEFNKKYFSNKLPKFNIFNFKLDNSRNYFGYSMIFFKSDGENLLKDDEGNLYPVLDNITIVISQEFSLSEESYGLVLLHEMIHIYQGVILKMWPDHDNTFDDKVRELKDKGIDVPVFEEPSDFLFKEKKKRELTYEEEKAFRLLYKDPFILGETEENGEHYVIVVAP